MSKLTIDMLDGSHIPKRGDLLQSVVADQRSRTWFVLAVHTLKPTKGVPRARLWVERWWYVDPELRNRLFRSAERNGGQRVINFQRYKSNRASRKVKQA